MNDWLYAVLMTICAICGGFLLFLVCGIFTEHYRNNKKEIDE